MQILKLSQPKNYAVAKPMWGGAKDSGPRPNVKGVEDLALKLFTTKDLCLFQNLEMVTKSGARVTIVRKSSSSELDFARKWQKTIQLAIYVSKMSRMYARMWQRAELLGEVSSEE